MVCPDCSSTIKVDLTATQYKEYEEEARIRYLKAQKVGGDKVAIYDRQSQVWNYWIIIGLDFGVYDKLHQQHNIESYLV